MATVITKQGSSILKIDDGVGEPAYLNWKEITIRPIGDFMKVTQEGVVHDGVNEISVDYNNVTTPAGTTSGENLCEVVAALFTIAGSNNVTTAQRNALTPSIGQEVYDTDLKKKFIYNGNVWLVPGELIQITNNEGTAITEGQCVKVSTLTDDSCELNISTTDIATIGVVFEGGANGAEITVAIAGTWNVLCNDAGTVGRNELCSASGTAGVASVSGFGGTGDFAVTLEEVISSGSDVLVKSILTPTERF